MQHRQQVLGSVELLAPAGSFDAARAAVNAGADAVYMGGPLFSARAYAESAGRDMLLETIRFCHLRGVKVYMTLNVLMKEEELQGLYAYLNPYYEAGLDAVIVQDLGVLRFVREHFPELPVHASTQMTVTGRYYAAVLKDLGVSRIVTARELDLAEIRDIHDHVGIEIEAFIHGALCYCYSGQCLMSSMLGGRSGNRGRCAGPCRLPYEVQDARGRKLYGKKDYVLSMRDLHTVQDLKAMTEAGVCSLKIEGRMKSPLYVAAVTGIYRKYLDAGMPEKMEEADARLLRKVFDRGGSTDAYLYRHNGADMIVGTEKEARTPAEEALIPIRERYLKEDLRMPVTAEAVLQKGKPAELRLSCRARGISASVEVRTAPVSEARNQALQEERIREALQKFGGTPFYPESFSLCMDEDIFLPVRELNELRRKAAEALEEAILRQTERKRSRKHPEEQAPGFSGDSLSGETKSGRLSGQLPAASPKEPVSGHSGELVKEKAPCGSRTEIRALAETKEQFEALLDTEAALLYIDAGYAEPGRFSEYAKAAHEAGKRIGLRLPHIFRKETAAYLAGIQKALLSAGFDAWLIRSLEELPWLWETGLLSNSQAELVTDHTMYAWNRQARTLLREIFRKFWQDIGRNGIGEAQQILTVTLPLELNLRELLAVQEKRQLEELVVYGRAPMMVSAQCVKRTVEGCDQHPEILYLRDRKSQLLPVKNCCRFCYNTIFNAVPTVFFDQEEAVKRLAPNSVRYEFTTETKQEVKEILHGKRIISGNGMTRGHFRRGVE